MGTDAWSNMVEDSILPGASEQLVPELKKLLEQSQIDLRTASATPSEPIYHYTDAAGLFGILTKRQIWATDSRFFNDPKEVRHGRRLLAEVASSFHSTVKSQGARDFLTRLKQGAGPWNLKPYFITSFSAARDSLSQWRGYANDGAGYALGFDASRLDLAVLRRNELDASHARLFKVEYDEAKQRSLLARYVKLAVDLFEHGVAKPRGDVGSLEMAFHAAVEPHVLYFKNPGFVEEREWRAVATLFFGLPAFRASARGVVPYVELQAWKAPPPPQSMEPLKDWEGNTIREIILGPKLSAPEHLDAAAGLLLSVKVPQPAAAACLSVSATPYR